MRKTGTDGSLAFNHPRRLVLPGVAFFIVVVLSQCSSATAFSKIQPNGISTRRAFLSTTTTATTASTFLPINMSNTDSVDATSSSPPLRVALLGAGIFARDSHAPTLLKYPESFSVEAVWSRSADSSKSLATTIDANLPSYSGPDGLDELLARTDVEAVVMALPLDSQPAYVQKAWDNGKHVLSEKPIASSVAEAKELVDKYRAIKTGAKSDLQWSVAENFRYEPAIVRAAEVIKTGVIGKPFLFSLTIRAPFTPDNKYLNTLWRKGASWYGGMFIDSFVHPSAMLRFVLGNAKTVSAVTSSQADYLPSVDTMVGRIECENGAIGAVSVTYACSTLKFELDVTGTDGSMVLRRRTDGPGYTVVVNGGEEESYGFGGIDGEFLAFAKACRGVEDDRNTPEEGLGDLALIEALLLSGKESGTIKAVA